MGLKVLNGDISIITDAVLHDVFEESMIFDVDYGDQSQRNGIILEYRGRHSDDAWTRVTYA